MWLAAALWLRVPAIDTVGVCAVWDVLAAGSAKLMCLPYMHEYSTA